MYKYVLVFLGIIALVSCNTQPADEPDNYTGRWNGEVFVPATQERDELRGLTASHQSTKRISLESMSHSLSLNLYGDISKGSLEGVLNDSLIKCQNVDFHAGLQISAHCNMVPDDGKTNFHLELWKVGPL